MHNNYRMFPYYETPNIIITINIIINNQRMCIYYIWIEALEEEAHLVQRLVKVDPKISDYRHLLVSSHLHNGFLRKQAIHQGKNWDNLVLFFIFFNSYYFLCWQSWQMYAIVSVRMRWILHLCNLQTRLRVQSSLNVKSPQIFPKLVGG